MDFEQPLSACLHACQHREWRMIVSASQARGKIDGKGQNGSVEKESDDGVKGHKTAHELAADRYVGGL